MEKQQRKDMNRIYTQFSGKEICMEDYSVQMVLHHLPGGLLHCSVSSLDQKKVWNCDHTGKQKLGDYCEQKELGSEELKWVYGGLLKNMKELQEYLLDANHLFLDPDEIYVDSVQCRVWNCFIPFYEKEVWLSLQELAQYLLGHLNQRDAEAVRIAYGMFRYFSQGGCSIEEAWAILCEKAVVSDEMIKEKESDMDALYEFTEEIEKETDTREEEKSRFPIGGWIVMGLSGAAAVFLFVYVAFNEWYLSDAQKVLLLALVVILGGIGILAWRRWSPLLKKKNPMEEPMV